MTPWWIENCVETHTNKDGNLVRIIRDPSPWEIDDRERYDALGKLIIHSKREYDHTDKGVPSWLDGLIKDWAYGHVGAEWDVVEKDIMKELDVAIMYPLRTSDPHIFGIQIARNRSRLDSGNYNGIYYVTHERLLQTYGNAYRSRKWWTIAENVLKAEVKQHSQWLMGEMYGYAVFDEDDPWPENYETIDSCWGFYGDDFKDNGLYKLAGVLKEYVKPEITASLTMSRDALEKTIRELEEK